MKEIFARLTSRSPKIFRQIQRIGVGLIAISVTIAAAPIAIPVWVVPVLATAGGVMKIVGKLPVIDSEDLPDGNREF